MIVFDEPTSSLAERDARAFVRDRRTAPSARSGDRLHQSFPGGSAEIAQTYTVLRDGRAVAAGSLRDTDLKTIITHMVGRELDELFPDVVHTPGEPILELEKLSGPQDKSTHQHRGSARRDPRYRRADRRRDGRP